MIDYVHMYQSIWWAFFKMQRRPFLPSIDLINYITTSICIFVDKYYICVCRYYRADQKYVHMIEGSYDSVGLLSVKISAKKSPQEDLD